MSEPRVFRCQHRVTYSECTVGNHVYHSRYLDILEAARGEFMRSAGQCLLTLQETGAIFPVVEARLRYHRPARYDDVLTIELQLVQLRGVRLGVHHRVLLADGRLVLEAETRHVCTSVDDKPRRLPPTLVAALNPWLATSSDVGSAER